MRLRFPTFDASLRMGLHLVSPFDCFGSHFTGVVGSASFLESFRAWGSCLARTRSANSHCDSFGSKLAQYLTPCSD